LCSGSWLSTSLWVWTVGSSRSLQRSIDRSIDRSCTKKAEKTDWRRVSRVGTANRRLEATRINRRREDQHRKLIQLSCRRYSYRPGKRSPISKSNWLPWKWARVLDEYHGSSRGGRLIKRGPKKFHQRDERVREWNPRHEYPNIRRASGVITVVVRRGWRSYIRDISRAELSALMEQFPVSLNGPAFGMSTAESMHVSWPPRPRAHACARTCEDTLTDTTLSVNKIERCVLIVKKRKRTECTRDYNDNRSTRSVAFYPRFSSLR